MESYVIFILGLCLGVFSYILLNFIYKKLSATLSRNKEEPKANNSEINIQNNTAEILRIAEQRELFFNMVLDCIPCQVFIKDPLDGFKYKIVNKNFIEYYKLNECDILEHSDKDIFELEVAKELRSNDKKVCSKVGNIFHFNEDVSFQRRGKEIFKSLKVAFKTADGHTYMLGVCVDITEESNRRTALSDALADRDMASDVANIASFRINYKTREVISGSKRLAEFWPIRNGRVIDTKEWVLPEDIGFEEKLSESETHKFYKYRTKKDGKIKYFRIFCAVDKKHKDEITGIIQDITEISESEKKLQNTSDMWNNLIEIFPVHFFSKNADDNFRYIHCNKKFAQFVDKPESEIIGKTDKEIFRLNSDYNNFMKVDNEVINTWKPQSITESACGANKTECQYNTVKIPFIGPNDERLLLGMSMDISKLVNMGRSRDVIKQCLEDLVSEIDVNTGIDKALKSICNYIKASNTFIMHFNTEQRTISCTKEYSTKNNKNILDKIQNIPYSTNLNWEEYFKKECFLNFPDLQSKDVIDKFGEFYKNIINKNNYRSLYCHRLIIEGKFWGYVGLAYENEPTILNKIDLDFIQSAARFIELMIRHKHTQEELHMAVEKSQEAEKAKSRFLATMSHEIRTPLNAVIGYSELLQDGNIPANQQKEYLKDISIAGNALLALINDILDLSKLEAGKMQFAKKSTNFPNLMQEVMSVFRQKAREKELDFIANTPSMPIIKVDELRFRQILFNLIGNAVKFTEKGSITISTSFKLNGKSTKGTLQIDVKDTGCGISKNDAKILFLPFEQSRTILGTNVANKGTGLGLSIVKKMIEYMNGEISLQSELGKGSTFTIIIHDIEISDSLEADDTHISENLIQRNIDSQNVLIVDDVEMNLKILHALLLKLGINSTTVLSAKEALQIMEQKKFDILLTDLWMPNMNGEQLAKEIRKNDKYQRPFIVAITADTEANNDFDMSVFDSIITKPITTKKLSAVIQSNKVLVK